MEVLAVEPSSWERRRNDVAMRIERRALELFVQRGIDETTVEDVAKAAGISRRTFYRYFGTIDDILIAMPKRSLKRISQSIAGRPLSESVREAFVNAAWDHPPSEEERPILALGGQLCNLYPEPWWRAMARVQAATQDAYTSAVSYRLRAKGQDTEFAPIIAAALIAVVNYAAQYSFQDGKFSPAMERLDEGLSALAELIR